MNSNKTTQNFVVNPAVVDTLSKSPEFNLSNDLSAHQKFDRLLEDPDGIYLNPATVDFTLSPVVAMRLVTKRATLAVQETSQIVASLPEKLTKATEAALIKADEVNMKFTKELLSETDRLFYSEEIIKGMNHTGILHEMKGILKEIKSALWRYEHLNIKHQHLNNYFSTSSEFMRESMNDPREILGEREKSVTKREADIAKENHNLEIKINSFNLKKNNFLNRSSLEHLELAYIGLGRGQAAALLMTAIGFIFLALIGAISFFH
jgi:hypothetical protein